MAARERYDEVKALFLRAVDLAPDAQRALVEETRRRDPELGQELRALLRMSEAPTRWLRQTGGVLEVDEDQASEEELLTRVQAALAGWDRFEELVPVGSGGMGAVFRAHDPRLRRPVAIKVLTRQVGGSAEGLRREAELQARVDHPHVLEVYETGQARGWSYIAMRFVEGPPFLSLAEIAPEACLRLMKQIAEGLEAAHALGLIHRDVKPGNILVERGRDGDLRPFLSDFGIAEEVGSSEGGGLTTPLGSPRYMAPEQLDVAATVDHRVDLYGLGATFYELLAGQPPFVGDTIVDLVVAIRDTPATPLATLAPNVPSGLSAIVMRCLEKDPERRFASAADLAVALEHAGARRSRRRRWITAASTLALVAAVALGVGRWGWPGRTHPLAEATAEATETAQLEAEAQARERRHDAVAARDSYARALAIEPGAPRLLLGLARAHLRLGHDAQARDAIARALADPVDLDPNLRLEIEAFGHRIEGDWDAAIERLDRLRTARPEALQPGLDRADVAIRAGSPKTALEILEALHGLPGGGGDDPRIDLFEADALEDLGDFAGALAAASRARTSAAARSAPHIVSRAWLYEAWAQLNLGDLSAARQAADQAEVVYGATGDRRGVVGALTTGAMVRRVQGDAEGALAAFDRALSESRALGDRSRTASILANRAALLADRGGIDEALASYRESAQLLDDLGRPVRRAGVDANIGILEVVRGDYAAARPRYVSALDAFREVGNRRGEALVLGLMAERSILLGALAEAEAHIAESRTIAEEVGLEPHEATLEGYQGWIARLRGDGIEAAERLTRSLAVFRDLGDRVEIPRAANQLANVLRRQGRLDEAEALYRESLEIAAAQGSALQAADAQLGLSRVALDRGAIVEAETAQDAALAAYRASEVRVGRFEATLLGAEIAMAKGSELALEAAEQALVRGRELGVGAAIARGQLAVMRAHRARGDVESAARALAAARAAEAGSELTALRAEIEAAASQ